jgi:glyoxylase-like metal-dependent hydrolase (beta-lactamase superfamily II)
VRLGNLDIHLISDGQFALDGGTVFGIVPKVLWERVAPADERNRVPMALNCLLVVSRDKVILVDTGYGNKHSPAELASYDLQRPDGGLVDALRQLGYAPADVDIVINTHLHLDHCGGNTAAQDGTLVPAFRNAEYWIQHREWADASNPVERTRRSYLADNFQPLQESGQLRVLRGDTYVTDEVRCVVTRGHTRSHQSVFLQSEGQCGLFLGDIASRAVHMERLAWSTAYDTEPLETLETKRGLRDWALAKDALLFFSHDRRIPSGRLRQEAGRYRVEPAQ